MSDRASEQFFATHRELIDRAVDACRTRDNFSAFDGLHADPDAEVAAEKWFVGQLSHPFALSQPGLLRIQTDEISPYTGQPLDISYPHATPDELIAAAEVASRSWRRVDADERVGVCVEICQQLFAANAELALAALHTTGQAAGMTRTGSGTNALDRGLEAIAMAHQALERAPSHATWVREFGRSTTALDKRFQVVPLGVAVVIGCASFPAWNVYPALFANLATANAVIVKPHPSSVLQMALAVRIARDTLAGAGYDPNLVTLAVDSVAHPVAQDLVTDRRVRIVDFTGSGAFGKWIEHSATHARVYTETSGANSVILDSVDDLAPVLRSLAGSLCLFSAQMCTSPQNIYLPRTGVTTAQGMLSADAVATALVEAIGSITDTPARAASVMGAIQSERTVHDLENLAAILRTRGEVLLEPLGYGHPDYPAARTSGPLVARIDVADHDLYGHEEFGPVVFVILCDSAEQALEQATRDAREAGAITAFVYSTDEEFIDAAEAAFATAGAALSINLTGPMPLNFSAAFSDFHVSGLNPAGTATLTDEAFIAGRYRIVQSRRSAAAVSSGGTTS